MGAVDLNLIHCNLTADYTASGKRITPPFGQFEFLAASDAAR